MDNPGTGIGGKAISEHKASDETEVSADLSSIFDYPSLGQLFDGADTKSLNEMRARLKGTQQEVERIIRQGTKDDALRAERILRAYNETLLLLDELEKRRDTVL